MKCPSTFLGSRCDGRDGHRGHHWTTHPARDIGYDIVWTDNAADKSLLTVIDADE